MGWSREIAICSSSFVIGLVLVFLLFTPWLFVELSRVKQSKITCSIEEFYIIAGNQSNNVSNFNQSSLYFKLYLKNGDDNMGVYYDNLNLTFSYNSSTGIVPVGNYTIPRFRQGADKKAERKDSVLMNPGISWQEITKNLSMSSSDVVFRVDLATAVKFREVISKRKSRKLKIMAWAKLEVDPITGKIISKKAIKLKHMIKRHVSGWVTLAFLCLILVTSLSVCICGFESVTIGIGVDG